MDTTAETTDERAKSWEAEKARRAEATRLHVEKVAALATAIAANLPGWTTVTEGEDSFGGERSYLVQTDGHGRIGIIIGGYQRQGRIIASAEWNGLAKHASYGDTLPTITIADTTTADKIAQAITRRLLPGYLLSLGKVVERNAAYEERASKVAAVAKQIAERYPSHNARIMDQNGYPGDTVCFRRLPTVNATSAGGVRFCGSYGFECSLDKAVRILDILAEDATE